MRNFHCPECGFFLQPQSHPCSFFRCIHCETPWCIIDMAMVNVSSNQPTLYGALGTFAQDDVIAPVELNTIDKGVSL
jgi:hypothetical protein